MELTTVPLRCTFEAYAHVRQAGTGDSLGGDYSITISGGVDDGCIDTVAEHFEERLAHHWAQYAEHTGFEHRSPREMTADLNNAALFLFIESEPDGTSDELLGFLSQRYDRREHDPDFGPLYQIGAKYDLEGRTFFHVQTFAGSLGSRIMLAARKGEFPRAIVIKLSDGGGRTGFDLIERDGSTRCVGRPSPK